MDPWEIHLCKTQQLLPLNSVLVTVMIVEGEWVPSCCESFDDLLTLANTAYSLLEVGLGLGCWLISYGGAAVTHHSHLHPPQSAIGSYRRRQDTQIKFKLQNLCSSLEWKT